MIICPNCNHREYIGALFCSECAAKLVSTGRLSAAAAEQIILDEVNRKKYDLRFHTGVESSQLRTTKVWALRLIEDGEHIPLKRNVNVTIGRVVDGQSSSPDIDLSRSKAYAFGVSRLHAELKNNEQGLMIIDLGSSNGTRVNGQPLSPHVEYPLAHGDIVTLGRLRIQIIHR